MWEVTLYDSDGVTEYGTIDMSLKDIFHNTEWTISSLIRKGNYCVDIVIEWC